MVAIPCWAAKTAPIPVHCVDAAHRLDPGFCEKVESVLGQHRVAAEEDVWVEVVETAEDAKRKFLDRNADLPRLKNLKVMVAIEAGLFRGEIYVGIGLDHKLPEAERQAVVTEILGPTLRDHRPEAAIGQTLQTLLEKLESPLADGGALVELVSYAEGVPLKGYRPSGWEVAAGVVVVFGVPAFYVWTLRKRRKTKDSAFSDSTRGDPGPTGASSAEWSPQDDRLASDTGAQSTRPPSGDES